MDDEGRAARAAPGRTVARKSALRRRRCELAARAVDRIRRCAASRWRSGGQPLAALAATGGRGSARPARVRMRRRNPCVLCRRRLFGWNVRLLTGVLSDVFRVVTPVGRGARTSGRREAAPALPARDTPRCADSVDMRHPSTRADRATVRAWRQGGSNRPGRTGPGSDHTGDDTPTLPVDTSLPRAPMCSLVDFPAADRLPAPDRLSPRVRLVLRTGLTARGQPCSARPLEARGSQLCTSLWIQHRSRRPAARATRTGERVDEADGQRSPISRLWTTVDRRPPAQPAGAWLAPAPVTLHENTAIVAVPDDFTRTQLETRLRPDSRTR